MKRTIIIEIFLLIALSITIYFTCYFFNSIANLKETITIYSNLTDNDYSMVIKQCNEAIKINIVYGLLVLATSLLVFISGVLIALKDFKPLAARLTTRKQSLKEAKKQKELEDKQQKLEKLQAEIDNLKNN